MPSKAVAEVHSVTWDDLHQASYHFSMPFLLELNEGEFFAERIVRLIPKKRMVVFGTWRGIPAVAKIFYDRKHGKRHADAEALGVKHLVDNKIPTPTLHYHGTAIDKSIHVIVFARVQNSKSLLEAWRDREADEDIVPLLQSAMIELATQHVLGVVQQDLHLGNFLISGKLIYTLDGGQIEKLPEKVSRKQSIENLALFLSQLGTGVSALQEELFLYYAKARGWLLTPEDTIEVLFQIKRWCDMRWHRFEKKIFRNSTDFLRISRFGMRGMTKRKYNGVQFQAFLQDPDSVFAHEDAIMLKDGRSSTVVKVTLDGHELVVKRHNMKNSWHRARRALRPTRAHKSWRLALKLSLFNVRTASPVAFLESKIAGLRGKSYFVTEYVGGNDIGKYILPYEAQPYAVGKLIKRTVNLLRSLAKLEITHGDLKSTNIIVNSKEQPVLIDLDGAQEHLSLTGLHKAWREEISRFMRNFNELPAIHRLFKRAMREE